MSETSATTPTTLSTPRSDGTQVILVQPVDEGGHLRPGFTVGESYDNAACHDQSAVVFGAGTCTADDFIFQPCWMLVDDTPGTFVCMAHPWETSVSLLHSSRTEPLSAGQPRADTAPWGVELTDGTRCRASIGARSSVGDAEEDVIDYLCGDEELALLRGFNRDTGFWTARSVVYDGTSFKPAGLQEIRIAWFGERE